jgi:hypothetical protein
MVISHRRVDLLVDEEDVAGDAEEAVETGEDEVEGKAKTKDGVLMPNDD